LEVHGQLHALTTLPTEEKQSVSIAEEAGWTPEPVWEGWRRENISASARNWYPGRPACSLLTIL